ncbi:MAG: ABC transporter substrate-binding protein [Methylobacillus sp.]|jgi:phospholipid transport system substrate-binding protein|nr:ABC transporter substrate-binding protein [Methylobacillus sp.]
MKLLTNLIAGFAAMTLMGAATAASNMAPDVLVKTTANDVLEIIKNDKDIQNGDTKKIGALAEAKILPNFDFDQMSRMVLGKYWAQASKEQQQQFVHQFRTLLVRTYSSALAKYRNQTIEYKPFRGQPEDTRVTVKTQIIQAGAPPLAIDYSLIKESDGSWKVYDVVIEGVSLVTNYRSQFANEVKQNGMDGLIKRLAEKNK